MQTRTKTEFTFEVAGDQEDRTLPRRFDLWRDDSAETRRNDRERWSYDPAGPRERTVVGTFTRNQMVTLITGAADWLAYAGEED